jgi:hypothetical protein
LIVVPAMAAAQIPAQVPDYTMAFLAPVFTTAVIVIGIVIALAIALHKTDSKDRADVVRAVSELFRWFRRGGGPPGMA